ncbi:MAG: alpha/beta hydrolase, partial [Myxococcota bacterium]|nr:alpha/beta hydrolase [Myxococcota bacterium]
AWYLPAMARPTGLALLFLHGNAGNASHRLPEAAALAAQGFDVLLPDYRGYGLSEGRPDEAGVHADARAALAWLQEEAGRPASRIVVFGRSLGGAVAVELARGRPLAALVLESTFTSVADVARSMLGFGLGPLLRGRFDAASGIGEVRCPVLVMHGDRDEIIPFELGRRLFERAPEPKRFRTIPGAGHNDTVQVGGPARLEALRAFAVGAAGGSGETA